jgi:hypothetical protein
MARSDSFESIIESNLDKIEQWMEDNYTDKEIAKELKVAYSTYRKYKSVSVALRDKIATVKDNKNQEVEKAVYNNAIGYFYQEEIVTKIKIGEFEEGVKISSVKKYKGPDLAAEKYWLNNKNKVKWRDDPNRVDNDKKLTKLKEKEVNAKVIDM